MRRDGRGRDGATVGGEADQVVPSQILSTAFKPAFLHIAVAQGEAIIEPGAMSNDVDREVERLRQSLDETPSLAFLAPSTYNQLAQSKTSGNDTLQGIEDSRCDPVFSNAVGHRAHAKSSSTPIAHASLAVQPGC